MELGSTILDTVRVRVKIIGDGLIKGLLASLADAAKGAGESVRIRIGQMFDD